MLIEVFAYFPTLRLDNGIILREIKLDHDYRDFYKYITHPEVAHYLPADDIPSNEDNAKIELGYWAKLFTYRSSIYWAIVDENTNKIIGTAGFNFWNHEQRRAEISYDLNYDFWGKGIMTKTIKAISDFALNNMQVQRIQATVAIDNFSSIKVLEKSGYMREGILHKYGILGGKTYDFYMYARTKS